MDFPNYVGAVDGTNILILCLSQGIQEFLILEGYFSVVLKGIVEHQGHFTHIFAGWANSAHDTCIFHNSSLPQTMESGHYTPKVHSFFINTIVILPLITGDPAYNPFPHPLLALGYKALHGTDRPLKGALQLLPEQVLHACRVYL